MKGSLCQTGLWSATGEKGETISWYRIHGISLLLDAYYSWGSNWSSLLVWLCFSLIFYSPPDGQWEVRKDAAWSKNQEDKCKLSSGVNVYLFDILFFCRWTIRVLRMTWRGIAPRRQRMHRLYPLRPSTPLQSTYPKTTKLSRRSRTREWEKKTCCASHRRHFGTESEQSVWSVFAYWCFFCKNMHDFSLFLYLCPKISLHVHVVPWQSFTVQICCVMLWYQTSSYSLSLGHLHQHSCELSPVGWPGIKPRMFW